MPIDPDKSDATDGNAHGEGGIRINPEVLKASPLNDVDFTGIEVVLVQSRSTVKRLGEGVTIHLAGTGLVAVIAAFWAGFAFTDITKWGTLKMCEPSTVSAPIKSLK